MSTLITKKIGQTVILALAIAFIIFSVEINFKMNENFDLNKINVILLWSAIKSSIISTGIMVFNLIKIQKK